MRLTVGVEQCWDHPPPPGLLQLHGAVGAGSSDAAAGGMCVRRGRARRPGGFLRHRLAHSSQSDRVPLLVRAALLRGGGGVLPRAAPHDRGNSPHLRLDPLLHGILPELGPLLLLPYPPCLPFFFAHSLTPPACDPGNIPCHGSRDTVNCVCPTHTSSGGGHRDTSFLRAENVNVLTQVDRTGGRRCLWTNSEGYTRYRWEPHSQERTHYL
jgi:hypothetical protein